MSRVAGRVFAMFGTRKVAAEQLAFPLSRQSKTDRTTDNRADLYRWATLYELDTGRKPFAGSDFFEPTGGIVLQIPTSPQRSIPTYRHVIGYHHGLVRGDTASSPGRCAAVGRRKARLNAPRRDGG